jgi:hypothetical protein
MERPTKRGILKATAYGLFALGGLTAFLQQNSRIDQMELQRIKQEQRMKALEDNSSLLLQEERDSADVLCAVANVVGQAIMGYAPVDCSQSSTGVSGKLPTPTPPPLPVIPNIQS